MGRKSNKIEFKCVECFQAFYWTPCRLKQVKNIRFCSRLCWKNYYKLHKIPHSEVTKKYRERTRKPFERMTISSAKYLNRTYFGGLREFALERDNFTCQKCLSREQLIVHHVDRNKYNNVLDNLITLCRRCHPLEHKEQMLMNLRGGVYL